MKYLIWTLVIIFIAVVVLIVTGWGDKGYDAFKKSLAEREIQENLENKAKVQALEMREQALMDRIRQKDVEISKREKRIVELDTKVKDYEKKLASITIPVSLDDRIKRLRELGLQSARSVAR